LDARWRPLARLRRNRAIPVMTELFYPPRWMRRVEAARWVALSPSKFDQVVKDGRLPAPKTIDGVVLWDRYRLDAAVELFPDRGVAAAEDDDWKVAV